MLGLGPRSSCRNGLKKLDILTIPSLYIFALMMIVVNNPDSIQSDSSIHCISVRQEGQLHFPVVKFSSIQKGVVCMSIKIFNNLPPNTLKFHYDIMGFKSALRKLIKILLKR